MLGISRKIEKKNETIEFVYLVNWKHKKKNKIMRQLHSYKSKWIEHTIRLCITTDDLLLIQRTVAKMSAVINRSSQKTWLLLLLVNDGEQCVSWYVGTNYPPSNKCVPY